MENKKFAQIDALRFFAVMPVLISHWGLFDIQPSTEFLFSSNGVNLFFIISGFLITLGLIRSREKEEYIQTSLSKFYVRRFLRIFPIYYLMLLFLWLFNHHKVADGIIWYLTYTTNFYCIKIQDWGGLSHLWSLALEEQFYFIWPFIILLSPKQLLPIIISATICLSVAFKTYCAYYGATFWISYMHPLAVLDILGLGALLAYLFYFKIEALKKLLHNNAFIAFVFLQLGLVLYCRFNLKYHSIYDILSRCSFGLFSAWIVGRAVFNFNGIIGRILTSKPLSYIGKISYGVYLLHILVPGMLMGVKYPINHTLRFCMYFILTIAICTLSWELFERQILKLKSKFE